MKGSAEPLVFVQDYHFALLPRLIKTARPDARVAIFWQFDGRTRKHLGSVRGKYSYWTGFLGADLIGSHIPLHCHNFLSTVDRVLESRTDREHMQRARLGHNDHLSNLIP